MEGQSKEESRPATGKGGGGLTNFVLLTGEPRESEGIIES